MLLWGAVVVNVFTHLWFRRRYQLRFIPQLARLTGDQDTDTQILSGTFCGVSCHPCQGWRVLIPRSHSHKSLVHFSKWECTRVLFVTAKCPIMSTQKAKCKMRWDILRKAFFAEVKCQMCFTPSSLSHLSNWHRKWDLVNINNQGGVCWMATSAGEDFTFKLSQNFTTAAVTFIKRFSMKSLRQVWNIVSQLHQLPGHNGSKRKSWWSLN